MSGNPASLAGAADEIAREVERIHADSFGRSPAGSHVAIHEDFVAVLTDVELTPAEEALVAAGDGEAVRTTREEFTDVIHSAYEGVVERATGRRVEGFTNRLSLDSGRPWSVKVFRLGPSAETVSE